MLPLLIRVFYTLSTNVCGSNEIFYSNHKVTSVTEVFVSPSLGLAHPVWIERFPWLYQGCTTRSVNGAVYDFGLFSGGSSTESVQENWSTLLGVTGANGIAHGHQVHGTKIYTHHTASDGLNIFPDCDGHVTNSSGVLLSVTTADCVPIFLVDADRRAIAVLHAGWRGIASGILDCGITALREHSGSRLVDLMMHLGPSICGACYEVGAEVFEALGQPIPLRPSPINLRGVLTQKADRAGIPLTNITVSDHCTRCTESDLFSHRAGDMGRQVSYIGLRP